MSNQPTVRVRGRKSATEKPREAKPKRSSWLYTVSTNQRYEDDDPNLENDEAVFNDVVYDICENIGDYLVFKVDGDGFTDDKVQYANSDFVVERGGKTKALHAHILIQISHHSRIHLDYEGIKRQVEESLGIKVYINGKLCKPTSDHYLSEYLHKHYAKTGDSPQISGADGEAVEYLPVEPHSKDA